MDDTYAIKPMSEKDSLPYARVDEWYYDQRRLLRQNIRENEDFSMTLETELNILNTVDRKSMFRPIGKGNLRLIVMGLLMKEQEKVANPIHYSY